ncbi:MAG: metallophosphoesterase family protein [Cellulosilyticaceae bacterium]
MKILVISDTHGNTKAPKYLIDYLIKHEEIECVLHCGDCIKDAKELEKIFPSIKFHMVSGNNDFGDEGRIRDLDITIDGVTFYMTHGHNHGVYSDVKELIIDAKAHGAQVALYGHTHRIFKETIENILVLNPGSLVQPRDFTVGTFAVLNIENSQVMDCSLFFQKGVNNVEKYEEYR